MTAIDPRDLRRAFGSFMTGITVVTTRDSSGVPTGFTANSFTSVSLDPPLLLVCPAKSLSSYETFATCRHFAVNILAEGQEDISNTFASFKGNRFARVAHKFDDRGNPLIDGAIAWFSCATEQVVEAGDHCLLIGQVESFAHSDSPGLGYAGGRYFSLGLERGALEPTGRQIICGAIIEKDGQVLLEKTTTGFRPPQITLSDRVQLRQNLHNDLARRGIGARLGAVYSIFDDATTHFAYILATASQVSPDCALHAVAIRDLPTLTYTTPAIADMTARYAIESQTRDFTLYLGDTQRGDVHGQSERND